MRGLIVNKDGSTFLGEMPKPKIDEYQALVKMLSGGLCGTDLKVMHNKLKGFTDYPTILGHEGIGEVVEIGAKVKKFKLGDIVVLPYSGDDSGKFYSTFGSFAEYGTVGDETALAADGIVEGHPDFKDFYCAQQVVPKELDVVSACMITTFREVYCAAMDFGFEKGKSIVIFGAGAVGLVYVTFAKMLGLSPIVSVDIYGDKREQAIKAGADVFLDSKNCDVREEIRKLFPDGVQMTLDAAGAVDLMNVSLDVIANKGKICVYGLAPNLDVDLDWTRTPWNWNLLFNQWPTKVDEANSHQMVIDMMLSGKLNGADYISDVFDFDDSHDAIKLFESRKALRKIAIKF